MEREALPEASALGRTVAFGRVTLGTSMNSLSLSLLICDLRDLPAQPLVPVSGASLPIPSLCLNTPRDGRLITFQTYLGYF